MKHPRILPWVVTCILLLLGNLSQMFTAAPVQDIAIAKTVFVGSPVNFTCVLDVALPYWIINQDIYYWSELPSDFTFEQDKLTAAVTFIIPVVKLWMNDTIFGCGNGFVFIPMGHLYAMFELNGPQNNTWRMDNTTVFFNCNNYLFNNYSFYVTWNINGQIYDPITMPSNLTQTQLGLQAQNFWNLGIYTIQCIVYSEMLWKNLFYYSEKVQFTHNLHSFRISTALNNSDIWTYNFTRLFFNETHERIAWRVNGNCTTNVKYTVVIYNGSSTINKTTTETEITLTKMRDTIHYVYVTAYSNGDLCGVIKSALKIHESTQTITTAILRNSDFCTSFNLGATYIWPKYGPNNPTNCLCPALAFMGLTCPCKNNSQYVILYEDLNLCWKILDGSKNNTVVLAVEDRVEELPNHLENAPKIVTNVISMNRIVIKGFPGAPSIIAVNESRSNLCLEYMNTFSGFSSVNNYTVEITDATQSSFTFTQLNSKENVCYLIPENKRTLLNDSCGDLSVHVWSNNEIGPSVEPANLLLKSMNSDPCGCFKRNVHVFVPINLTQLSLQMNVECQTAYDNIEDISFDILLESYGPDIFKARAACSQNEPISFNIVPSSSYNISIKWRPPSSEECLVNIIHIDNLPTTEPSELLFTYGVISAAAVLIISLIVILFILCAILGRCFRRNNQLLRTISARTENREAFQERVGAQSQLSQEVVVERDSSSKVNISQPEDDITERNSEENNNSQSEHYKCEQSEEERKNMEESSGEPKEEDLKEDEEEKNGLEEDNDKVIDENEDKNPKTDEQKNEEGEVEECQSEGKKDKEIDGEDEEREDNPEAVQKFDEKYKEEDAECKGDEQVEENGDSEIISKV